MEGHRLRWRTGRPLASLLAGAALATSPSRAVASELVFSAEEAFADLAARELTLRGDVEVSIAPYRLTSEALVLRKDGEEIVVEGPARLRFCDCLRAPLAVGFDAAEVSPDGDLKLRHPRLEIAGTTVFALPWFWLRPATRPGLLPPTVAYRGQDGLLLGGGVHLPWSAGANALDLGLAGYLRGGFEWKVAVTTPSSAARLRWDRLKGDLVGIDAVGSAPLAAETTLSWDVDAIRGRRTKRGIIDLEDAAEAYDRARIDGVSRLGPVLVTTGMRALGERGGEGLAEVAFGPNLSVASSGALGARGDWDALAIGEVWAGPDPSRVMRAEAGLGLSERLGLVAMRGSVRESLLGWVGGDGRGLVGVASASLDAGVPIFRGFGAADDRLLHVLEPRAELLGLLAHRQGDDFQRGALTLPFRGEQAALASAGIRTSVGSSLGTRDATAEVSLGALSTGRSPEPEPLLRYRAGWDSPKLALSLDGASTFGEARGEVLFGRARLGDLDAGYLTFEAAGRDGADPSLARLLSASISPLGFGGFLSLPGWTLASEAGARWLRVLRVTAGAVGDASARQLLGWRGSLGYDHPCGCLGAGLHGQQRLGRPGVDVFASLRIVEGSQR